MVFQNLINLANGVPKKVKIIARKTKGDRERFGKVFSLMLLSCALYCNTRLFWEEFTAEYSATKTMPTGPVFPFLVAPRPHKKDEPSPPMLDSSLPKDALLISSRAGALLSKALPEKNLTSHDTRCLLTNLDTFWRSFLPALNSRRLSW